MEDKQPVIVQTIVSRKNRDSSMLEFLLLKRNKKRGGFWNVVNGTLRSKESVLDCVRRELEEEAGIIDCKLVGPEIYRFHFSYNGSDMTVIVHYVEVFQGQEIVINEEHTEYRWVGFEEAKSLLKFDDDKKALALCYDQVAGKDL